VAAGCYTSRMADLHTQADFDEMYTGTPPWDIGHPQPSLRAVADAGGLTGRVLDAGCGTGEHALMAAALGLDATGIDGSPRAIDLARRKAAERGIAVRVLVADALDLGSLGETFDTVIDSGLFHVFSDEDRARYVDSLRAVTAPGGRVYVLCFSDRFPPGFGPRRVTQDEIRASFSDGWTVEAIEAVNLEVNISPNPVLAWLATIERRGE
jgi:cyclopropane fatty-acyl-phospholipid synthase-like methyltransferase